MGAGEILAIHNFIPSGDSHLYFQPIASTLLMLHITYRYGKPLAFNSLRSGRHSRFIAENQLQAPKWEITYDILFGAVGNPSKRPEMKEIVEVFTRLEPVYYLLCDISNMYMLI